jgi:anti-sigma regulatory factor (Ser/Thr protein kinase)
MSRGQLVSVRPADRHYGLEPPPMGLPRHILPSALMPGALLPTARWVSRQFVSPCPDAGLASRGARDFAEQVLRGWGLQALTDDAAVIVSELVTNALQHGGSDLGGTADQVEVILWRRAGQVVCAVTDAGAEPPAMASPDPFSEAGRGLHVIQALSANWGWTRLGGRRKAVWAALRIPAAGPPVEERARQSA